MLIVGGGFSGLGAAIRLQRAERSDYLVIERGHTLGGTWRDNTYPGAACDVPSPLYSFSFAPHPDWTRAYSAQPEIQAYLQRLACEPGVGERIRLDCELLAARWDGPTRSWVATTSQGTIIASILVTAFGALCEPAQPLIKGLSEFAGPVFHSARWRHDYPLADRRVAVIGTGASAIQFVPEIAPRLAHLDVYQRTAAWVLPQTDHEYSRPHRAVLRHLPGYRRLVRAAMYATRELTAVGFCYRPRLLGIGRRQALAHLSHQVADPALARRLTPDYALGCKRVLRSNQWYPALQRDNVELVTDAIIEVGPHAVITADGRSRPVDAIVLATGFHVTDSPAAELIRGRDGHTLAAHWRRHGQQAYKGTSVAGFPNLFLLIGPNTGLGHTSMIYMIESQLNYLLDALRVIDQHQLATVEVRRPAQDAYNRRLHRRMARTVWTTGGCRSWYLDRHGHNTTLWPGFTFVFRWLTRRFTLDAYDSTAREDGR